MKKIFLYLVRRDKNGVKVVVVLQGLDVFPTRIDDIGTLKISPDIISEIESIIYVHRLEWELWLESADTYEILRKNLVRRGYKNVPSKTRALCNKSSINNPYPADIRSLPKKQVMIQKGH